MVKEVFSKPIALAEKVAKVVLPGYGLIAAVAKVIEVDKEFDRTVSVKVAPPDLVESPWGQAKQLYNVSKASSSGNVEGSLAVYCVRWGRRAQCTSMGG